MAVFEVLWRQRLVVALILVVGIAATVFTALTQVPKYQATATVLYTGHDAGNSLSLGQLDMATLVTSQVVTTRAMRKLHVNESLADFTAAIAARPAYQSNVMPISFTSTDSELAVDGANALAHGLRDYFLEVTRGRFDGLSTYLDNAIRKRQQQVAELDHRLDMASAGDPALAGDDAMTVLNARLNSLLAERDHSAAELTGSQAQVAADSEHLGAMAPLARKQIADTDYVYRALQGQWASDAAQLASQRSAYTSAYPGMSGLSKKVAGEGNAVNERLSQLDETPSEQSYAYVSALAGRDYHSSVAAGGEAQVSAYDREIDQVRQELARLPEVGSRLAAMRRERDTARAAYDMLAQRRELLLAEQAQAATTGTIEVIDEARVAVVSSRRGVLLNVGAALGFLLLAITVAFLLDSADRRMRSMDSISEVYGKPIIATVKAS